MYSNDLRVTNENELDWPAQPSGILIMGKRQGTKRENKQLWGRMAMGAALWHSAPQPKPYLIFVASDCHGPLRMPDAEVVKAGLMHDFGIPGDFIILRQKTNCTLLEVRAARAISRVYGLAKIFAVTHLYHAPRTQRYISEIVSDASVIPVHPAILDEISFPAEAEALFNRLQKVIRDSLPGPIDSLREYIVEWLLNQAHSLDPRGHLERRLAKILRPGLYR
jgi:uncharacterized SAM-binding protein YcdF (DUF218 family)